MDNSLNMELGRKPPQSIEVEECVLGAILLESQSLEKVVDIIIPNTFYKEENCKIYQAVLNLYNSNKGIDIITVPEELKKLEYLDGVGGIAYITGLTTRIGSSHNIVTHARIIQSKFIQRELIRVSTEIQTRSYSDDIDLDELINFAEQSVLDINQHTILEVHKVSEIIRKRAKVYETIQKSDKKFSGIPTGHNRLDRVTLGFQPQDLIILAARPSVGKTQIMLHFAFNAAIQGYTVLIFTLEMSKEQLTDRLLGIASKVNPMKARMGILSHEDWENIETWINKFIETNILMIDKPAINITEVRSICRRMKRENNIDIVYIDYLQLMTGERQNGNMREQEVSSISRGCKLIAKELKLPVVALSQLSRSIENRGNNKKPQLSDLRESGAIEQDADLVGFLHREKEDDGTRSLKGEIILSKHRNGATVDLPIYFDSTAMLSMSYNEEFDPIPSDDLPF